MANNKNKKKKTGRKTKAEIAREEELKQWISIVLILALTIIAYAQMGVVGVYLSRAMRFVFGKLYFFTMGVIVAQIIIYMINSKNGKTTSHNPTAIILIMIGIVLWCAFSETPRNMKGFEILSDFAMEWKSFFVSDPAPNAAGGILGAFFLSITTYLVDWNGTVLVIIVLLVIAALLLVNLEVYKDAFHTIRDYFSTADLDVDNSHEVEEVVEEALPEVEDVPLLDETSSATTSLQMINVDSDTGEVLEEKEEEILTPTQIVESKFGIKADKEIDVEDDIFDMLDRVENGEGFEEVKPEEKTTSIFMNVDDLIDKHLSDEEVEETPSTISSAPLEHEPVSEGLPDEATLAATSITATGVALPETPRGSKVDKPYELPSISLLDPIPLPPKVDKNAEAAKEKGELLIQVLKNFDIEARLLDVHIGPSVTKFEIRPEASVKVSKILNLTDDIKMQLAVKDIRIEAPIPGHNAVGVEIPNVEPVPVKMRELIGNVPEKDQNQPLVIVLGKDLLGQTITCRLDKMPHMLIAGATGSGKSVCMNSIITSILLRTKPDEVKLLLVDPKKVEFTPYQKIPHLIGPVINDPNQANNALKVIVKIMDERYDTFARCGVRNIQSFNQKVKQDRSENAPKPMPYIVVIIDELADLMAVAGKDVESSIQRITQLARAAGIHLIVATQRPSTDVITGIIKANIPSRIAFSVSSGIDSRTILDHVGAERLLGYGDMLYFPIGASAATRVQGVFVTDDEVRRISDFTSAQQIPMFDDSFIRLEGVEGNDGTSIMGVDVDPLYDEVKRYVVDVQKASTSLLQRRFSIGYNRAARMIDMLEEQGVIGPAQGSKPRDVFLTKEDLEEE